MLAGWLGELAGPTVVACAGVGGFLAVLATFIFAVRLKDESACKPPSNN